jgi:hypothetical protein
MNYKMERFGRKVLSEHLPGRTEKNHKKLKSG